MKPNFKKSEDGLLPVIIQHFQTAHVLMLGYMNEEAFYKTQLEQKVTFYSRSKQRLWTKGEQSTNYLLVKSIHIDCDNDALLIQVDPMGPTCHTGTDSCFNTTSPVRFTHQLETIIEQRINEGSSSSYTNALFQKGINKIAQKVGEEAVELVIEAKDNNLDLFKNEAADLLYHYLLLLKAKGMSLQAIEEVLEERHRQ